MRQTVRLGRVAGLPVGMHWSVDSDAAVAARRALPRRIGHKL
jgi:hypothetical protein